MASIAPGNAVLSEGLLILGWVAMWKPVEIFLYDWWPEFDKERLFARISHMSMETLATRYSGAAPAAVLESRVAHA
ncbi:MAG TPA: hypothetical protein VH814_18390 [Steroidobacteraceae bacterium]